MEATEWWKKYGWESKVPIFEKSKRTIGIESFDAGKKSRDDDFKPLLEWARKRNIATLNEIISTIPQL